jgi:hypothetical protein
MQKNPNNFLGKKKICFIHSNHVILAFCFVSGPFLPSYSTRWFFSVCVSVVSCLCVGVKLEYQGGKKPRILCVYRPIFGGPRMKRPTTTAAMGLRKTKRREIHLVSFRFCLRGRLIILVKAGRQYSLRFEIFPLWSLLFKIWLEFTFVTKGIALRTIQMKETRISIKFKAHLPNSRFETLLSHRTWQKLIPMLFDNLMATFSHVEHLLRLCLVLVWLYYSFVALSHLDWRL